MSYPNAQKPNQKGLVQFALDHPDEWHTYMPSKEVVELLCATANLGIIKIAGKSRMFKLKSKMKARTFLNN